MRPKAQLARLVVTLLLAVFAGCGVPAESTPRVIPPEDVPFCLVTGSTPTSVTTP